jgi:hypothetical protein
LHLVVRTSCVRRIRPSAIQDGASFLFASPENYKVSRYYSYSFSPSCAGVDAFSLSWEGENAYCAPPIALILRVIRKIKVTRMKGVGSSAYSILARSLFLAVCFSGWEALRRGLQIF